MRHMSLATFSVLNAVAGGVRYGFDILDATGLASGTVYPILTRLENDGLLRSRWEDEVRAHGEGRPARRYYAITRTGEAALKKAADHFATLVPGFKKTVRVKP
jgi:DNA-binding PadR family transcriptional regulator